MEIPIQWDVSWIVKKRVGWDGIKFEAVGWDWEGLKQFISLTCILTYLSLVYSIIINRAPDS